MKTFEDYRNHLKKIADINNASALLNWDQETYMPKQGARFRAQQLATLAGISHNLATSKEFGDLLRALNEDTSLSDFQRRNVAETLKEYKKNQKFDAHFVQQLTLAISDAFQAWNRAKAASDFAQFAPALEKLVLLKKQQAAIAGYDEHPYDALIDDFEPGTTTSQLTELFNDVKDQLVGFVKHIAQADQPDDSFLYKPYPKDKQWEFGLHLLRQMGYNFEAGRQDISAHPFTTNFSCEDVRVTTRINENNFNEMTWSCIHEGGHALYEQGLLAENYGLPAGNYLSLAIHESQSRLWENNVGRGLNYWKANYEHLQNEFTENLSAVSVNDFYVAINKVKPNPIRTSADELTYHFHVLIRFEIEKALMEGSVTVNDLPSLWNRKYKDYLGIEVPSDDQGVLQDIHWSHGSFGYFPTYSLGSFYAVQFYNQASSDLPGLEQEIEQGNMQPLLNWLRENIHQHGRLYTANELCERVTGEPLNFSHFMRYANEKYTDIYQLKASIIP